MVRTKKKVLNKSLSECLARVLIKLESLQSLWSAGRNAVGGQPTWRPGGPPRGSAGPEGGHLMERPLLHQPSSFLRFLATAVPWSQPAGPSHPPQDQGSRWTSLLCIATEAKHRGTRTSLGIISPFPGKPAGRSCLLFSWSGSTDTSKSSGARGIGNEPAAARRMLWL